MATNNISVNYDDERFQQVEADKKVAMDDLNNTYNGMLGQSDQYYQAQIDASKEWAEKQQELQNQNTQHTVDVINQQKEQAQKDYSKEQSGAYVDWQKQSNKYGVNAEQQAMQGLNNTGYSESSQVSMYNQYQSRVATARESFNKAVLNYDNSIKEAQLTNNAKLAEIAYQAQQMQLELSLQGFQYKNQLLLDQINKKQELDNTYYSRYQDVLNQINTENSMAEQIRQYNESLALQKQQMEEQKRQYEQDYALQVKEYNESIRQFDTQIAYYKEKDAKEYALKIKQLEEEKRQAQIQQQQWEKEYQLKQQQMAQEQSNWEKEYALAKQSASKSSSSSGSASITKSASIDKSSGNYAVNTAYYQGDLSADAKEYGTFSNGYQPQGIIGHGQVKKTGDTITFQTQTLSGQKQTVTQNIWKTSNNKKWYWDGRKNAYVELSSNGGFR